MHENPLATHLPSIQRTLSFCPPRSLSRIVECASVNDAWNECVEFHGFILVRQLFAKFPRAVLDKLNHVCATRSFAWLMNFIVHLDDSAAGGALVRQEKEAFLVAVQRNCLEIVQLFLGAKRRRVVDEWGRSVKRRANAGGGGGFGAFPAFGGATAATAAAKKKDDDDTNNEDDGPEEAPVIPPFTLMQMRNPDGDNALHLAVGVIDDDDDKESRIELVKLVLDRCPALINGVNFAGESVLHRCSGTAPAVVKFLLEKKPELAMAVSSLESGSEPPLMAILDAYEPEDDGEGNDDENRLLETVVALLDAAPSTATFRASDGVSALEMAVSRSCKVTELLLGKYNAAERILAEDQLLSAGPAQNNTNNYTSRTLLKSARTTEMLTLLCKHGFVQHLPGLISEECGNSRVERVGQLLGVFRECAAPPSAAAEVVAVMVQEQRLFHTAALHANRDMLDELARHVGPSQEKIAAVLNARSLSAGVECCPLHELAWAAAKISQDMAPKYERAFDFFASNPHVDLNFQTGASKLSKHKTVAGSTVMHLLADPECGPPGPTLLLVNLLLEHTKDKRVDISIKNSEGMTCAEVAAKLGNQPFLTALHASVELKM